MMNVTSTGWDELLTAMKGMEREQFVASRNAGRELGRMTVLESRSEIMNKFKTRTGLLSTSPGTQTYYSAKRDVMETVVGIKRNVAGLYKGKVVRPFRYAGPLHIKDPFINDAAAKVFPQSDHVYKKHFIRGYKKHAISVK
jgi:hypothetical protein